MEGKIQCAFFIGGFQSSGIKARIRVVKRYNTQLIADGSTCDGQS